MFCGRGGTTSSPVCRSRVSRVSTVDTPDAVEAADEPLDKVVPEPVLVAPLRLDADELDTNVEL